MANEDGTWTYPQPKEVVELNWWNASEERVKHANKIWSGTYDKVEKAEGGGRRQGEVVRDWGRNFVSFADV